MKKISNLDQLKGQLRDKFELALLANIVPHLEPESLDLFCMAVTAYLRFGIQPMLQTAFVQGIVWNFITMLEMQRQKPTFQVKHAQNPLMLIALQIENPKGYDDLLSADTSITREECHDYCKSIGLYA